MLCLRLCVYGQTFCILDILLSAAIYNIGKVQSGANVYVSDYPLDDLISQFFCRHNIEPCFF